jgi:hypothetical protein
VISDQKPARVLFDEAEDVCPASAGAGLAGEEKRKRGFAADCI